MEVKMEVKWELKRTIVIHVQNKRPASLLA